MGRRGEWQAALAALAATAGTSIASGREIALFYAQMGGASWTGVALSAGLFGLLTGLCAGHARRMGAKGFPALCRTGLGKVACGAAGVCHGLLLALASAALLLNAGALGALTLPTRHGFLQGLLLALLLAGLLDFGWRRALPGVGLALLAVGILYYAGMALDARPPRLYLRGDVVPSLSGSFAAAIVFAACHAALNGCLAADAVCRFSAAGVRAARLGALCGALSGLLMAWGNATLLRGGAPLLALAWPMAPMAARWGLFGFWLSAGFGFLCDAASLACALLGLAGWLGRRA